MIVKLNVAINCGAFAKVPGTDKMAQLRLIWLTQ
jgi:hypothetical protein